VKRVRFILASASPARLKTLRGAGVQPEVIVSNVEEESVTAESTYLLVSKLASMKCLDVHGRVVGAALVLGCDSMLEFEGESLGKPGDYESAVARWKRLRGRSGILHTGHALENGRRSAMATVSTRVHFADVSDEEIDWYCGTGEPQNVAGGFTIDGFGGWFVSAVEGDPHNVVGLSLPILRTMLAQYGLTIADLGYPALG
jgi:septum formation protein